MNILIYIRLSLKLEGSKVPIQMEAHIPYLKTWNGINLAVHTAQLMSPPKDPQPFPPEWTSKSEIKGTTLGSFVTRIPYLCDIRAQSKWKLGLGQQAWEVTGPTGTHVGTKRSFPGSIGRQVLFSTPGYFDLRFSGSSKHLPKSTTQEEGSQCADIWVTWSTLILALRNLSGGPSFFLWSPRAVASVLPLLPNT